MPAAAPAANGCRRLARDRGGAAAVTFAIALPALVGLAGIGTEGVSWYLTKRTMQGAADSAAAGAGAALAAGITGTPVTSEAKSIAARFSFVDGTGGTTVTVNNPPLTGTYQGNANYVEVSISQPQGMFLSKLFMSGGPTISVRAVAKANTSVAKQGCVLALSTANLTGLDTSGTPVLNLPGCAVYVNASSPSNALNLNGGAAIVANAAYVVGGINGTGLTTTDGTYTGVLPIVDPYANVSVPAYSGCDKTGKYQLTAGQTDTITPGSSGIYVFCNSVVLDGGSTLNLSPGIYVIDGSSNSLTINGNSTLNGTGGVTIILTNSKGGSPATVNISSNANVNITAPTTGATAGLAFFQDRLACTGNANQCGNSFSGGTTQNITGAIYFPKSAVSFTGGSAIGGAQCTQLIADTITFSGVSTFNNDCNSAGTKIVSITGGKLVQ